MIILAPGGIGNQLFSLAFALYLSERNKFKISVFSNSRELVMAFQEKSNASEKFQNVKMVFGRSRNSCLSRMNGKVNNSCLMRNKSLENFVSRFVTVQDPEFIPMELIKDNAKTPFLVSGFFQNASFIESLSESIKSFLGDLITDSSNRIETKSTGDSRLVGVHIRRGDYIKIPEYGILSMDYFARNLNDVGKEGDKVIVASDDLEVLHDFVSLRDVEILTPNIYSPLETMRRLTASKVFIMSNSTFSFWIGWLVSLRGGIVIRPNPWFKQSNVSENYLFLNRFLNSPSEFEIM